MAYLNGKELEIKKEKRTYEICSFGDALRDWSGLFYGFCFAWSSESFKSFEYLETGLQDCNCCK